MNILRLLLDDGALVTPELSSPAAFAPKTGKSAALRGKDVPILRVLPPPVTRSDPLWLVDIALRRQRNWEAAVFFLMAACGLAGILGAFVAAFAGMVR